MYDPTFYYDNLTYFEFYDDDSYYEFYLDLDVDYTLSRKADPVYASILYSFDEDIYEYSNYYTGFMQTDSDTESYYEPIIGDMWY